jgi:glutamate synthase domain-containing protein 2
LGLKKALIDRYFRRNAVRIEGVGIEEVSLEAAARHRRAFEAPGVMARVLDSGRSTTGG